MSSLAQHNKTMKSWHVASTVGFFPEGRTEIEAVRGNAADIVDNRYWWSGIASKQSFKFWTELGEIARAQGCEWGGDWEDFKGVAHIQMLFVDARSESTITA